MKPPLYVRPLTAEERTQLEAQLRSSDAFTLRRAQILLASARGLHARQIAETVGCSDQTVRNAIRAFHTAGLATLARLSTRPKSAQPELDAEKRAKLQHILHQSPRAYGKSTSVWTLALLAEVCFEQGLSAERRSLETIRRALQALNVRWQRAKHWISSPDPAYARKKSDATD